MSTPITIEQWRTFDRRFTMRGSDGQPWPLPAEYEVLAQVRRSPGDTKVAATFAVSATGTPGELRLALTPDQTGALALARSPRATYCYDVVLRRKADNWRGTLFGGPVVVKPGVTR